MLVIPALRRPRKEVTFGAQQRLYVRHKGTAGYTPEGVSPLQSEVCAEWLINEGEGRWVRRGRNRRSRKMVTGQPPFQIKP